MPSRSLVPPTTHAGLERALLDKLAQRNTLGGRFGELEPLAVRLGLMQRTLKPALEHPQLLVFAADHGLAVDGLYASQGPQTKDVALDLLAGRLPLAAFARSQGLQLAVVDCGVADDLGAHEALLSRKIAHGTRNARLNTAMTLEQAHAAMRAGMEIGEKLRGNALALAGLGVGGNESAAMVLARLAELPVRDLALPGPEMEASHTALLLEVLKKTQSRHRGVADPVEVLAAFGGFEIAMMAGVMVMAASRRALLMIDGLPACAALLVAQRIDPGVSEYCVFCRSHPHRGLDRALALFGATAFMELGLSTLDGTGATLTWPLVRHAAALLGDLPGGAAEPAWPPGLAQEEDEEETVFPGERLY
jgi:nicotinate-nucleotide--dimethylbenzimidazole phosphoribosyltransferase